MKKVNFESESINVKSVKELIRSHDFIGFKTDCGRYMIVNQGNQAGFAFTPNGVWDDVPANPEDGEFFVFDTKNELLEWMKD